MSGQIGAEMGQLDALRKKFEQESVDRQPADDEHREPGGLDVVEGPGG